MNLCDFFLYLRLIQKAVFFIDQTRLFESTNAVYPQLNHF